MVRQRLSGSFYPVEAYLPPSWWGRPFLFPPPLWGRGRVGGECKHPHPPPRPSPTRGEGGRSASPTRGREQEGPPPPGGESDRAGANGYPHERATPAATLPPGLSGYGPRGRGRV